MRRAGSAILLLALAGSLLLNLAGALSPTVSERLGQLAEMVTGRPSVPHQAAERERALESRAANAEAEAEAGRVAVGEARATAVEAKAVAEAAQAEASRATAAAEAARRIPYRGSTATPAEAVADTADRLAALALQSSSGSVASSYAEALPVIGLGVIAANTAAQVDANCQIMAALNELSSALNPGRTPSAAARAVCAIEPPDRDALWQSTTRDPAQLWADARALHPDLPALQIGPQWLSAGGMWQAVYDWAYGSPAGPPDAAGQGPAGPPEALAPWDWQN